MATSTTSRQRGRSELVRALEAEGPLVWRYGLWPNYVSRRWWEGCTWRTVLGDEGLPPERRRVYVPESEFHAEFWTWYWQIEAGKLPVIEGIPRTAIVAIWSRGFAKSTNGEMAAAAAALRRTRAYALYISDTQDRANDHVGNVARMLTAPNVLRWYPDESARRIQGYRDGARGAWRRDRVQTNHFTIDALGLDSSLRGARIDEDRPDLIILDDIDGALDSPLVTTNKIQKLTRDILPARAQHGVTVFLQNLIHRDSIASRLVDGRATFLARRYVLGPHPALRGFDRRVHAQKRQGVPGYDLTGGTPTWEGFGLAECQALVDEIGLEAFMQECQHEVRADSLLVYGQFDPRIHTWARVVRVGEDGWRTTLPRIRRFVGGLDFGGEGLSAHFTAGVVAGIGYDERLYVLATFKERGAKITERLLEWMAEQETKLGMAMNRSAKNANPYQRVAWAADATQEAAIQLMRGMGFNIRKSRTLQGAREFRIGLVGTRLAVDQSGQPGLYYLGGLDDLEHEFEHYRRVAVLNEEEVSKREVLRVNDDLMSALEYLVELVDGDVGPDELTEEQRQAQAPRVSW